MTEIDKMVNQAFPEELRKVTPIPVDEEKIAALTFQKLGLERSTAAEAKQAEKPRRKGRYAMRHGQRKPEPQPELVAVPIEPARPVWRTLVSWSVAACLLVGCVLWFGPALLRSLPWEERPSEAGGVMAGGALPATEGAAETETEAGGDSGILVRDGAKAADEVEVMKREAEIKKRDEGLKGMMQGLDDLSLSGQSACGEVRVLEVTPMDWQNQITVTVAFPGYPANEIGKFSIELYEDQYVGVSPHVAARENVEGSARVTFQINMPEEVNYLTGNLLIRQEGEWGVSKIWGYNVYIDMESGNVPEFYEFSIEQYEAYGYAGDGPVDDGTEDADGTAAANGSVDEQTDQ